MTSSMPQGRSSQFDEDDEEREDELMDAMESVEFLQEECHNLRIEAEQARKDLKELASLHTKEKEELEGKLKQAQLLQNPGKPGAVADVLREQLEKQLDEERNKNQVLLEESAQLQVEANDAKQLVETQAHLLEEAEKRLRYHLDLLDAERTKAKTFENEVKILQKSQSNSADLQSENEETRSLVIQQATLLEESQGRIQELEILLKTNEGLGQDIEDAKRVIEQQAKLLDEAQVRLQEEMNKVESVNHQNVRLEERLLMLQSNQETPQKLLAEERQRLVERIQVLEDQIQHESTVNRTLMEDKIKLVEEREKANTSLQSEQKEVKRLSEELHRLTEAGGESSSIVDQLKADKRQLENQLQEKNSDQTRLEERGQIMEETVNKQREQMKEMQALEGQLREDRVTLDMKLRQAQEKERALEEQLDQAKDLMSMTQQELDAQLHQLGERLETRKELAKTMQELAKSRAKTTQDLNAEALLLRCLYIFQIHAQAEKYKKQQSEQTEVATKTHEEFENKQEQLQTVMAKLANDTANERMEMVLLNCMASWHQWSRLQSLARSDDSFTTGDDIEIGFGGAVGGMIQNLQAHQASTRSDLDSLRLRCEELENNEDNLLERIRSVEAEAEAERQRAETAEEQVIELQEGLQRVSAQAEVNDRYRKHLLKCQEQNLALIRVGKRHTYLLGEATSITNALTCFSAWRRVAEFKAKIAGMLARRQFVGWTSIAMLRLLWYWRSEVSARQTRASWGRQLCWWRSPRRNAGPLLCFSSWHREAMSIARERETQLREAADGLSNASHDRSHERSSPTKVIAPPAVTHFAHSSKGGLTDEASFAWHSKEAQWSLLEDQVDMGYWRNPDLEDFDYSMAIKRVGRDLEALQNDLKSRPLQPSPLAGLRSKLVDEALTQAMKDSAVSTAPDVAIRQDVMVDPLLLPTILPAEVVKAPQAPQVSNPLEQSAESLGLSGKLESFPMLNVSIGNEDSAMSGHWEWVEDESEANLVHQPNSNSTPPWWQNRYRSPDTGVLPETLPMPPHPEIEGGRFEWQVDKLPSSHHSDRFPGLGARGPRGVDPQHTESKLRHMDEELKIAVDAARSGEPISVCDDTSEQASWQAAVHRASRLRGSKRTLPDREIRQIAYDDTQGIRSAVPRQTRPTRALTDASSAS